MSKAAMSTGFAFDVLFRRLEFKTGMKFFYITRDNLIQISVWSGNAVRINTIHTKKYEIHCALHAQTRSNPKYCPIILQLLRIKIVWKTKTFRLYIASSIYLTILHLVLNHACTCSSILS